MHAPALNQGNESQKELLSKDEQTGQTSPGIEPAVGDLADEVGLAGDCVGSNEGDWGVAMYSLSPRTSLREASKPS